MVKKENGSLPPDCPYDPSSCGNRFDALEGCIEALRSELNSLSERVKALPNGSKIDLILDYVQSNSARLTKFSPKLEVMSQRVDEAQRVANVANSKADENFKLISTAKDFRDSMFTEILNRLQRMEERWSGILEDTNGRS